MSATGDSARRQRALEGLGGRIRACQRCPSMAGRRRVPGAGAVGAAVFFLAEAPGRLGAGRTGRPMDGDRSAALFAVLLAAVGLDAADVFVTNVVKCNPLDAAGRNRAPAAGERAACDPFWRRELALVRPRLLVPLGACACRAATGLSLRDALCRLVAGPTPDQPAFALYHPAFANRHGCAPDEYRRQWARMRSALDGLQSERSASGARAD